MAKVELLTKQQSKKKKEIKRLARIKSPRIFKMKLKTMYKNKGFSSLKGKQRHYVKSFVRKLSRKRRNKRLLQSDSIRKLKSSFKKHYIDFLHKGSFEERSNNDVNILKAKFLTSVQIKFLFIFDLLQERLLDKNLFVKLFGIKSLKIFSLFYNLNKLKKLKWRNFCKFFKNKKREVLELKNTIKYLRRLLKVRYFFYLYKCGFVSELDLKVLLRKFFYINENTKFYYFKNLRILSKLAEYKNNKIHLIIQKDNIGDLLLYPSNFFKHIINFSKKYIVYKNLKSRIVRKSLRMKRRRRRYNSRYAKFPSWPIKEFIFFKRRKKKLNPYFLSKVFRFFYRLNPFKLWQLSRKARKKPKGGVFLDFLSFYELKLDVFIVSLGLLDTVQNAIKLIKNGIFCINGRLVTNSNVILKPFNILSLKNKLLRQSFCNKFLINLSKKRFIKKNFDIPKYIECNFKLFYFMYLPLYNKYKRKVPFFLPEGLNTGRFEIERI